MYFIVFTVFAPLKFNVFFVSFFSFFCLLCIPIFFGQAKQVLEWILLGVSIQFIVCYHQGFLFPWCQANTFLEDGYRCHSHCPGVQVLFQDQVFERPIGFQVRVGTAPCFVKKIIAKRFRSSSAFHQKVLYKKEHHRSVLFRKLGLLIVFVITTPLLVVHQGLFRAGRSPFDFNSVVFPWVRDVYFFWRRCFFYFLFCLYKSFLILLRLFHIEYIYNLGAVDVIDNWYISLSFMFDLWIKSVCMYVA